jgi:hypothetical protein
VNVSLTALPDLGERREPARQFQPRDEALQVRIFAPTEDRAKQLSQAYITLVDYGVRDLWQAKLRDTVKDLPPLRTALKESQTALAEKEKEREGLKEYQDIGSESLTQFRTQQRLIGVDLTGVEARIEACNKILSDPGPRPGREQVLSIKIASEIDLVGLTAKRRSLETIIEKGRQRLGVLNELPALRRKVASLQSRVKDHEELQAHCEQILQQGTIFARVVSPEKKGSEDVWHEGKIILHRITYLEPSKQDPR